MLGSPWPRMVWAVQMVRGLLYWRGESCFTLMVKVTADSSGSFVAASERETVAGVMSMMDHRRAACNLFLYQKHQIAADIVVLSQIVFTNCKFPLFLRVIERRPQHRQREPSLKLPRRDSSWVVLSEIEIE